MVQLSSLKRFMPTSAIALQLRWLHSAFRVLGGGAHYSMSIRSISIGGTTVRLVINLPKLPFIFL
jgi:hypothetical protein